MEIKQVLYSDIDEALERLYEEDYDPDDTEVIRVGEEESVVAYAPVWHVTDKGIYFVEGVWCNYNETTNILEPDWSVTLIYDDDKDFELDKFVYFDSSSPSVAIHNYLFMKNQKN